MRHASARLDGLAMIAHGRFAHLTAQKMAIVMGKVDAFAMKGGLGRTVLSERLSHCLLNVLYIVSASA